MKKSIFLPDKMKEIIKNKKVNNSANTKIEATDQYVPDDEKTPSIMKDQDDIPEEDPYENPLEEPPAEGEGP
jgi:hypothetical protein